MPMSITLARAAPAAPTLRQRSSRAGPVRVVAYTGGAAGPKLKFIIQRELPFGCTVAVVGSKPALGEW